MESLKLFKHQKTIIDADPKKTGLFLGTGSGKSTIALSLARGKILVICPKTIFEDMVWEREMKKLELDLDLTVVSKETFRRDSWEYPSFDTVIVDEAETCLGVTPNIRYRNGEAIPKASQLFEALEDFLDRTNPERLYLVTATIIRSPFTVWAAGRLLGRNYNFYSWRSKFYVPLPMPGREVWQAKTDNETKDCLTGFVQRMGYIGKLEDFFDVPEQTFKTIHVDLTTEQKKRVKDMLIEYPEPIVRVGKTHQIENGLLSGDEFSKPEFFDNKKIDKIIDLALEFPKMVVFAKYTAQIAQIATSLRSLGYNAVTLTGQTKDRHNVISEANKSNACIIIIQAQISAGFELPDFPVMVFASTTYSVTDRIQAEGRILRANALKKNLYITLVARDGVDQKVANCIENKKDFNERLYCNI